MRSVPVLEDTYYHVYNRGNKKQTLFYDKADYARFLFLLLSFQSPVTLPQTNRHIKYFLKHGHFKISSESLQEIISNRYVEVVSFTIMPNHYHVCIKNCVGDGLSKYMHRIGNAYAKYFNTRYDSSGHVFQGTYKAKLVESDKQLVYLTAYIHKNPCELDGWDNRELGYVWSSYQDYKQNRWGKLLVSTGIIDRFSSFGDYQYYVETSGAKLSNT